MEVTQLSAPSIATNIHQQVQTYITERFLVNEPLSYETALVDDLGADSLDLLEMVHDLNKMFNINIDAETLPQMLTVGEACDLVLRLVSESAHKP